MVIFTDFIPNPVDRYEYGYTLLYIVAFAIVINLTVLIFTILRSIYRAIKKFILNRRKNQRIKRLESEK